MNPLDSDNKSNSKTEYQSQQQHTSQLNNDTYFNSKKEQPKQSNDSEVTNLSHASMFFIFFVSQYIIFV